MPELPEVETTRRGIRPHLVGRRVVAFTVRDRRLRWPVPEQLDLLLPGLRVEEVRRRAKYLLIDVGTGSAAITGTIIWHLGMSGRLRIVAQAQAPPAERHDHVDLVLDNGRCMRFTDPRRFGCVLWHDAGAAAEHPLLAALGPEPLGELLTGAYLYHRARGRRAAVKAFLMDSRVVVGIGNIYASEALHRAGIHPARPAGRIAEARYVVLAAAVRAVLGAAIAAGGTTLRDFVDEQGRPGYFANELAVYGRAGQPCPRCGTPLRQRRLAQRSTFFCPRCQR